MKISLLLASTISAERERRSDALDVVKQLLHGNRSGLEGYMSSMKKKKEQAKENIRLAGWQWAGIEPNTFQKDENHMPAYVNSAHIMSDWTMGGSDVDPAEKKPRPSADKVDQSNGNLDQGYRCDQKENGVFNVDALEFRHPEKFTSDRKRRSPATYDRVIGGQFAKANAWPWIAYFYGCGATLVASEWAVTAAHCCTLPEWYFSGKELCFGHDKKRTRVDGDQCASIAKMIQHPGYDRKTTVLNDICLIRLGRKIEYNNIVQPACLPSQGDALGADVVGNEDGANNNCYVAGWGYTLENQFHSIPKWLQDAKVNALKNETCDDAYHIDGVQYYREDNMSCFGHLEGKIDACQGDSGGPLICLERSATNPKHINPVLRGVVSWGQGCAQAGNPGVYARVSKFVDWIHTTIKNGAQITHKACKPPKQWFKIKPNAIIDCSWKECIVHCKDEGFEPNIKKVTCDEYSKKYQPFQHGTIIECAPKQPPKTSYFTKCGAITSHFKIDFTKFNVKCCFTNRNTKYADTTNIDLTITEARGCGTYNQCFVTSKIPDMIPNVSEITCKNSNKYDYEDVDTIIADPLTSIHSKCGSFFKRFPNARKLNLVVKCKGQGCSISSDTAFLVEPVTSVACKQKKWLVRNKVVTGDLEWATKTFEEYSDALNTAATCTSKKTKKSKKVWDHIKPYVSTAFQNSAKVHCSSNSKGTVHTCFFYCPGKPLPVKIKRKFTCNTKKGVWKPPMKPSIMAGLMCL